MIWTCVLCCAHVSVLKAVPSTRSGENDVEYSGNLDLEEGEIPDDVIGATGDLFLILQHSLAPPCTNITQEGGVA